MSTHVLISCQILIDISNFFTAITGNKCAK